MMTDFMAKAVSTTDAQAGISGFAIGAIIIGALIVLAIIVVTLVAAWKVFVKAGRPGWVALVPFYNQWTFAKIAGRPGWWGLNSLLCLVPFVGIIATLVVSAIIAVDVAHCFGKDTKFGLLALWALTPIGYMLLAYEDVRYIEPKKGMIHKSFGAPDKN